MTQGTLAARPAFGTAGARYYARDEDRFYYDDGTGWHELLTDVSGLTPAAASAAYVQKTDVDSAVILTSQSTTSTSFTDLATVGPVSTKHIGPSGRALVIVSAQQTNPTGYAIMSFAAAGPTPVVASDDAALTTSTGAEVSADRATLVTGLAEGDYTFTAKYRVPGGTGTFQRRRITVIPL